MRESPGDLPDLLLPPGHLEILETKYKRAKGTFHAALLNLRNVRGTHTIKRKKCINVINKCKNVISILFYNALLSTLKLRPSVKRRAIVRRGSASGRC